MPEDISTDVYNLLFNTRRSRRYHELRIKFFQRFSVLRLTLMFISTSTTFVFVLQSYDLRDWLQWIAGLAAFFTGIEFAVRFSAREQLHRTLLRLFVELERDITAKGRRITEKQFDEFSARYIEIEMDEPPVLQTLNRLCYNAEIRARYPESQWQDLMKKVSLPKRILASFFDLQPHTHEKINRLAPS